MKKSRIISLALLIIAILCTTAIVVACTNKETVHSNDCPHSDEWVYDTSEHWQIATCNHEDKRVNVEEHIFPSIVSTDDVCSCGAHRFASIKEYELNEDKQSYTAIFNPKMTEKLLSMAFPMYHDGLPVTAIDGDNTDICEYDVYRKQVVYIPRTIETIKKSAFSCYKPMISITFLPGSVLNTIECRAFNGTVIRRFEMPDSVKNVDNNAFANTELTYIKWSATATTIPTYCFYKAEIDEFEIPDTVTKIENYAFEDCRIESLTIPSSVTELSRDMLLDSHIQNLTLPSTLRTVATTISSEYISKITLDTSYFSTEQLLSYSTRKNLQEITFTGKSTVEVKSLPADCNVYFTNECDKIDYSLFATIDDGKRTDKRTLTEYNGAKYTGSKDNPYIALVYVTDTTVTDFTLHPDTRIICDYAFDGCDNLETVNFNDKLYRIQGNAFADCTKITSLTLPQSVRHIDDEAFKNCPVTTLNIPSEILSVGENAFAANKATTNYNGITYIGNTDNPYLVATGYLPDTTNANFHEQTAVIAARSFVGSNVKVANMPQGLRTVCREAFYDCDNLLQVNFNKNSNVTTESCAFADCSALIDISMPLYIHVGKQSFHGCHALQSIYFEQNATALLDDFAFAYCGAVQTVVLPLNTEIRKGVLEGGKQIKYITMPVTKAESLAYSLFGLTVYYERPTDSEFEQKMPIALEMLTFTDGEVIPGIYLYEMRTMHHVTLPQNLKTIGDASFQNCSALEDIEVAADVKLGLDPFGYCDALETAVTPYVRVLNAKYVTILGQFDDSISLQERVEKITFAGDITYLPNLACLNAKSLKEAVIPDTVTSLGISAFAQCTSLTTVKLSSNLTAISEAAFKNCQSLTSINLENLGKIERIDAEAFYRCKSLKSMSIPANTIVGKNAFYDCNFTELITPYFESIPDAKKLTILNGDKIVLKGNNVEQLTLPETLTTLPQSALNGCTALTELVLPGSLTTIGDEAFAGCTALKKITINEGVKTIGAKVFYGCTALKSVTLPDSINFVDGTAFSQTDITDLTVKNNIYYIGSPSNPYVFAYKMDDVNEAIFTEGVKFVGYLFTHPIDKLVAPYSLTKYSINEIVIDVEELVLYTEEIPKEFFYKDSSSSYRLKKLYLGERLKSIGNRAFTSAHNLTSLVFEGSYEQWQKIDKGIGTQILDGLVRFEK